MINTWHIEQFVLIEVDQTHQAATNDENESKGDHELENIKQEDNETGKYDADYHLLLII